MEPKIKVYRHSITCKFRPTVGNFGNHTSHGHSLDHGSGTDCSDLKSKAYSTSKCSTKSIEKLP